MGIEPGEILTLRQFSGGRSYEKEYKMDNHIKSNLEEAGELNLKLEDFYREHGQSFARQDRLERLYIQCLPDEKRRVRDMAGNLGITMSEFSLSAISYICTLLENRIEKIKAGES